ncbi:hypothetical protein DINM_004349 [Dirofilaria immitis]|nr:hypothetical protein [Dirofilaria immitis]
MSWIAKVSHIADHAENLLNQIDQNAAVNSRAEDMLRFQVLRNTKKDKSGSTMCLVDIESQGINKLQKPRSEIVEAPTVRFISCTSSHRYRSDLFKILDIWLILLEHFLSIVVLDHNKMGIQKKDDELIAYLNNSNEPTSSRCSSAASYFSAPNPQIANNVGTTSELCTTEEYLKAQYSDTLKCLHVKERSRGSQYQKDVQIAELDKELKLMKEELEAEYNGITNDLKKLQREHNKEKEEFEKREQDYVKRLKSANNENSETEQELQKLRTKILKMEMNEQNLVEEVLRSQTKKLQIRLAKYNLEANKHEFDEYKQRAQKILSAKENLLTSLKENSSAGSNGVTNSIELEELRCELDLLKDDLQQSQFLIYNLKGDIQASFIESAIIPEEVSAEYVFTDRFFEEMENKLRDEQRVSGIQRENLLKQIDHHLSQANQCREQMERTQLKYDFLQAEMNRQEEAVERKLAEKDIELMKLIEKTKANKRYEIVIEKIESEKRALELRLERAEYACRNAEIAATKAIVIEMRRNSVNSSDRNYSLFAVLHSDNMFIRSAKLAASIFDHLGQLFYLIVICFYNSSLSKRLILQLKLYRKFSSENPRLDSRNYIIRMLESMASVAQIPQSLRSVAHYVKIGADNADRDPIIHYWCKFEDFVNENYRSGLFYAVQTGMDIDKKIYRSSTVSDIIAFNTGRYEEKLSGQEALTQDLVAQAHIENFAMKLFDYADKNDRQSNFTKGVVRAFYTAGHLIDVLTLFGELDENLIATRKYAKWKATYIHSCIKNGEIPKPGSDSNQAEMREEPQLTRKGSVRPVPNLLDPSHIFSDSAPFVETSETSHILEEKSSSQEMSENSDSGRLTLDDYIEAQKYAKYAVSALSYEDSKTAIETEKCEMQWMSTILVLCALTFDQRRFKEVIMFGRKSKNKNKKGQYVVNEVTVMSPFTGEHAIFAVPLSLAVLRMGSHDGIPLPVVVRQCIDCINEKGLCVEGIHRISAPKANLDKLEEAINSRYSIQLEDIHDASGLLKRFLRQLPEHILTNEKRPIFEEIAASCPCGTLSPCRCLVADMLRAQLILLPGENYMLLAYIFIHSQMILQNSDKNKMGMAALGLILQATLNVSQPLVRIFLLNASDIILMNSHSSSMVYLFKDVQIKR